MSSDNVEGGGLSVILHCNGQLGPKNERMILGPLRFANHDCNPNCQVGFYHEYMYFYLTILTQIRPIKGSHAHVLISIADIHPGDAITVSYTKDGYHDPSQPCLCSTCQPHNPPRSPERRPPLTDIPMPKSGPKTRRGGKRARSRKKRQEERLNAQAEGKQEEEEARMSDMSIDGDDTDDD
jgi:hypothetical protein